MRTANVLKAACVAGLSLACAWAAVGCTASASSDGEQTDVKLTGGVAATVNGEEISEDEVTLAIEATRTGGTMQLSDQQAWGEWLAQNDYTPESVREEVIGGFVDELLLEQGAAEKGIVVEDSEVDGYVSKMRANYDSDEAWNEALTSIGLSVDEYRERIRTTLMKQRVVEMLEVPEEADEAELLSYAQRYAPSYDGAKRSSHILFSAGSEEEAQQVLDQINAGTLDFADAAAQYSNDGSATNGGDVGWDALTTFVGEYQTALDSLEKGQVSGLVNSQFGIHIIKCTDVFDAPDEITSIDELPTEFADALRGMVEQNGSAKAYQDWLAERKEAADIVINPMPAEVPYNVDMSQFPADDAEGDDASSDGSAEGDDGQAQEAA